MIVTYLSSSSINTGEMCEQKFFIEYVLKLKSEAHYKAVQGTIAHKVLEILALESIAKNKNESKFVDEDFGDFTVGKIDIEELTKKCFHHLKHENTTRDWNDDDIVTCFNSVKKAITVNNGAFDPRNLRVLHAEKFFDITIDEDWAKYEYKIGDITLKGQLAIKGVIDLVVDNNGIIEIIDWKTGSTRINWASGEEKNETTLDKDTQLLLYYYVAKKLFPDAVGYASTIVFINAGGAYTVDWQNKHDDAPLRVLKENFEQLKSVYVPSLLWQKDPSRKWFCNKVCPWGQGKCKEIHQDIVQIGMTNTLKKHGNLEKITSYVNSRQKESK